MTKKPVYKRILLKLSGEALQGRQAHGIDAEMCASLAHEIKKVKDALKKATGTDDAYYAEIAGYQIEEAGALRPCKKSKEITPDFRKILLEKLLLFLFA